MEFDASKYMKYSMMLVSTVFVSWAQAAQNAGDINVGETVSDIVLDSGDRQAVFGTAQNSTINTGAIQNISTSGNAINTTINGGLQAVLGQTSNVTVNDGGRLQLDAGGYADGVTVNQGGYVFTIDSPTINRALINTGGVVDLIFNGKATNTTIAGGELELSYGTSAENTTINAGDMVLAGGSSATKTIINGGVQTLNGNAVATDTEINSGGTQQILGTGVAETAVINAGGNQNIGAQGTANNSTLNGGQQYVLGQSNNATVNSGGKITLATGGTVNDAIINQGGNIVTFGSSTLNRITVNTGGVADIWFGAVANITTVNGGELNLSGTSANATTINEGEMYVYGGATAESTVVNGGLMEILQNSDAANTTVNGGRVNVNSGGVVTDTQINGGLVSLETGSRSEGGVTVNSGGELLMDADTEAKNVVLNQGTLSVADIDDISTDVTPAYVDALTMNNGLVSFLRNSEGDFSSLAINTLSGSGDFFFNSSLAERNANFVTINRGTGQYGIRVTDSGKEISDDGDLTVNLINDKSSGTSYILKSSNGKATEAIDGGTYMYSLYKQANKDGMTGDVWYLGEYETPVDSTESTEPGGELPGGGTEESHPKTTPSTDAILSMASASTVIVNSELDALRTYRRAMGVSSHEWNVWGHYMGDVTRMSDIGTSAYKLYQNGLEMGADRTLAYDAGYWVFGGLVSYTNNRVGHARGGKSSVDSYGIGAYSTWYHNRGFYFDGVLKANRLNSDLSATMTNGGNASGDWHQYLVSSSLEAGYQFRPSEAVTIEPYVLTTGVQANSTDVSLSNGMKAQTGRTRSWTFEGGSRFGTSLMVNNTELKPYLTAAIVQEVGHPSDVVINGDNRFDINARGTYGKYGLGTTVAPNKDTTLYAELNYKQGSHVESPIYGVLGVRVGF